MFTCKGCDNEFRDGALCSACQGHFDFACAGVTEAGYRRLGERKATWRCISCKNSRSPFPASSKSPVPADMDALLEELKRLSLQVAVLPGLNASIQTIKAELSEFKEMRSEVSDIKSSIEFLDQKLGDMSNKISDIEKEIQSFQKTKGDVEHLQQRVQNLEQQIKENEQRCRLNNIEVKGVPISQSENLFDIIANIGARIKCILPKDQINYIARVPMRNDKQNKTIVVSVLNRYLKDEFVAVAKKSNISAADLGYQGTGRVYINDHLTLDNKMLLNRTKALAKERGFAYTWVKGCRIFVRKNSSSPVISVKSESDLKKL